MLVCCCGEENEIKMYKAYNCVTNKCSLYCVEHEGELNCVLVTLWTHVKDEDTGETSLIQYTYEIEVE